MADSARPPRSPRVNPIQTLTAAAGYSVDVRKSRFRAQAAPVEDPEAAADFVASVREPGASHHCWAWRVGPHYRFFDDGEPGGTAGRPILAAIDGQGLDRVAVVVVRWFGGIKLGAGGLARAYGGCAAECLRRAPKRAIVATCRLRLRCDFAAAALLHNQLGAFDAARLGEDFDAHGVTLSVSLPLARRDEFVDHVRDLTRGAAEVREA